MVSEASLIVPGTFFMVPGPLSPEFLWRINPEAAQLLRPTAARRIDCRLQHPSCSDAVRSSSVARSCRSPCCRRPKIASFAQFFRRRGAGEEGLGFFLDHFGVKNTPSGAYFVVNSLTLRFLVKKKPLLRPLFGT